MAALAGLVAVLGHIFPVWLKFKGGKGVATTMGVFFALNWVFGLAACGMWLLAFLFLRISSLAAMLSVGYSPIAAYLLQDDLSALLALALGMLMLFTHRDNIKRLLEGSEHSFRGSTL